VSWVFGALYLALLAYVLVLILRLVFDWVQVFARDWRPRGVALVAAETAYTLTDPPLRFLRKLIPPLRLGSVQLDLGFLILVLACTFAMQVVSAFI
jgi:YggT family protein